MPTSDTSAKLRLRRRPTAPGRRRRLVAVLACSLMLAWALTEPYLLSVERSVVTSPDLPVAFDGTRVVFAADIHAGRFYSQRRVRSLVKRINAENPDLVILGGDYVGGHSNGAAAFYPEIDSLRARDGVVAVLGNHDYWEGRADAIAGLDAAGITVLDNSSICIRRGKVSITIAGVADQLTGDPDVSAAASGIAPEEFAVLISHVPDYLDAALPASKGLFDLALSGHTHGGQVTVFGLWAPILPSRFGQRYRGGWLSEEGVPVLVTRGVATVGTPLRFFARPQLHVIELRRGPAGVQH